MSRWLSDSGAAAWVQAIGSVVAILVAIWVPAWQRQFALRDARAERAGQEKEHLRRLTAGLRAEIYAVLDAANCQKFAVERTLEQLKEARGKGATVVSGGPIQPGSMVVTDAIVYRQIAAELGRLPPELIKTVVLFYTLALDFGRLADGASTAQGAYETIQDIAPRLKMHAALLIRTLDKFEASDFMVDADIRLKPEEVKELATKVEYPLAQVLKERGFWA